MLRVPFPVFLCAALLFAASAPAWAASPAGVWYGEGQPEDPGIVYLDRFDEDGTFIANFRKYENCMVVYDHIESGRWFIEDGRLITVIEISDGMPVAGLQEYRLEGQTEDELRLRHVGTEYLFVERRANGFEFPSCGYIS